MTNSTKVPQKRRPSREELQARIDYAIKYLRQAKAVSDRDHHRTEDSIPEGMAVWFDLGGIESNVRLALATLEAP